MLYRVNLANGRHTNKWAANKAGAYEQAVSAYPSGSKPLSTSIVAIHPTLAF